MFPPARVPGVREWRKCLHPFQPAQPLLIKVATCGFGGRCRLRWPVESSGATDRSVQRESVSRVAGVVPSELLDPTEPVGNSANGQVDASRGLSSDFTGVEVRLKGVK